MSELSGTDLNNWLFGGESDGAFALQHPNGNPMVIAKSSLSPETQDQIRGLAQIGEEQKVPFLERVGKAIGSKIRQDWSGAIDTAGNYASAVTSPAKDLSGGLLQGVTGYEKPAPTAAPAPTEVPASNLPPVDFAPAAAPQTATTPQQQGAGLSNPTTQEMMLPFDMQKQAAKQTMDYNNLMAEKSAELFKGYNDQIQKTQNEFMARDAERQKLIDEQIRDLSDPAKQIDPSRKWNNMSTGNKILASISILLGGLGTSATGGKNLALERINKAIDDDIESQKQNRTNKLTLYQKLLEQGKSDAEATNLLKSMGLANVETQMKLFAANNAKLLNSAGYLNGMAQIQGQQNELKTKYSRIGLDQRLNNGSATLQEALTYGNPDQVKEIVPIAGTDKYLRVQQDNRKGVQDSIAAFKNISQKIDRLNAMGKTALLSKDGREEAKQVISSLTGDLLKSNDLTRLSPQTIKILEDQVSDPTKFLNWIADKPEEANTRLKGLLLNDLVNDLQGKVLNPQNIPFVLGTPSYQVPAQNIRKIKK